MRPRTASTTSGRHSIVERPVATARALGMQDGIPVGISGGAIVWAAVQIAKRPDMAGKRVVAMVPGFAERYVSTVLFEGL